MNQFDRRFLRNDMENRTFLPVIYVRGTFYQVGYDVVSDWVSIVWVKVIAFLTDNIVQGRTFKSMIEELVQESNFLNDELLPAYNTKAGRKIYDDTVALMKDKFPHYVKELQGISDGSQVPFYKVTWESWIL